MTEELLTWYVTYNTFHNIVARSEDTEDKMIIMIQEQPALNDTSEKHKYMLLCLNDYFF